ncbi:MAG: hypothetical protein Kow0092_40070 [Deferrisomatales bacterium]
MGGVAASWVTFLAAQPYGVVFGLLLLTGLGLPVPEDLILLAGGAAVSWGQAGFFPLVGAALAGVLIADTIVFQAGRRWGFGLLQRRPFRYLAPPGQVQRASRLFRRHGVWAVFLSRFVPGLRMMTFFFAGTSGMRATAFFAMDATASLVSVPLLVFVGVVFGGQLEAAAGFLRAYRWHVLGVAAAGGASVWAAWRLARVLGLWRALGDTLRWAVGAGAAYLRRRRAFRLVLVAALVAASAVYGVSALRSLPGADRNYARVRRIPPVAPGAAFAFAVLGDNRNNERVFEEVLRRIEADPEILFAVDLGDLVLDGERGSYRRFLRQTDAVGTPLLVVPGERDVRGPGRSLYYRLFGPLYYSFRVGDAVFVALDNAERGLLAPSQWQWALDTLGRAADARFRFVLCHVPLFDPRDLGPLEGVRGVLPKPARSWALQKGVEDEAAARQYARGFARLGVTRVFASHVHGFYRGAWAGVPFTVTGGAGAPLVGVDPQHDFFHYVKVKVGPEGVREEVVRIPSPPFGWLARAWSLAALYFETLVTTRTGELALFALVAVIVWDAYAGRRPGGEGRS